MTSPPHPPTQGRRRYASTRREKQAEQTRVEVLTVAVRLFADRGWAGTTMAAIAAEAEVVVETIYKSFKSKKALLQAAMDFAIVGDADPVPLLEREEFVQLPDLRPEERLPQVIGRVGMVYSGPVLGVWSAMLEAATSDSEVARWCAEHEQRRRQSTADIMPIVFGHPIDGHILDAVWALAGMEIYLKLTRERGWTHGQWQDWVVATIYAIV